MSQELDDQPGMAFNKDDALADMPDSLKDVPLGPVHGIAAIALNMALKYHDINTVQDGMLYQQYKLEGKNMVGLHLDHVFHTAQRMEEHLIAANGRVAKLLVAAALDLPDDHEEQEDEPNEDAHTGPSDAP